MIAEGNYGQTEGVFLCLLSFARAKKVRRLPAATGTTVIVARDCLSQSSPGLESEGEGQTKSFSLSNEEP